VRVCACANAQCARAQRRQCVRGLNHVECGIIHNRGLQNQNHLTNTDQPITCACVRATRALTRACVRPLTDGEMMNAIQQSDEHRSISVRARQRSARKARGCN
jgi:hypothetical protein